MMTEKARHFYDLEIRAIIIQSSHLAEAKKLGRKVNNFDLKVWNKHKFTIVKEENLLKFSKHEALKEFLMTTNDRVLVEANPS